MNERAELLVRLLQEGHGLQISETAVRETISEHVDHVAATMRVGRQAAKVYVTEAVVGGMAVRIAAAIREHRDSTPTKLRIVK